MAENWSAAREEFRQWLFKRINTLCGNTLDGKAVEYNPHALTMKIDGVTFSVRSPYPESPPAQWEVVARVGDKGSFRVVHTTADIGRLVDEALPDAPLTWQSQRAKGDGA